MTISDQCLQLDAPIQVVPHLSLQSVGRHGLLFSGHITAIEVNLIDSFDTLCRDGAAQTQNPVIGLQSRQRHSHFHHHE